MAKDLDDLRRLSESSAFRIDLRDRVLAGHSPGPVLETWERKDNGPWEMIFTSILDTEVIHEYNGPSNKSLEEAKKRDDAHCILASAPHKDLQGVEVLTHATDLVEALGPTLESNSVGDAEDALHRQVGVLPHAEGGSTGLCPVSEDGSGGGCASKALELYLLSGQVVHLQVQPGDNVHVIKEKAARDLQQPASVVQLSQDGRLLQSDELIVNCSGSPIIVVLGGALNQILSAAALDILQAFSYSSDRATIEVLDFTSPYRRTLTATMKAQPFDEASFAEVMENSMPCRLMFSAGLINIERLAASLHRGIPSLQDLKIYDVCPRATALACIVSLLRSCPNLQSCHIGGYIRSDDVRRLRSLFKARITI